MRTRTILPAIDRGSNTRSYTNQVDVSDLGSTKLLYWQGELQPVTLVGSSPGGLPKGPSALDLVEFQAVLRYASGGISREETWSWQPQGWTRTLLASQVEVTVNRVDGGASPRNEITMGASCAPGAWQRDTLSLAVQSTAALGSIPQYQLVPSGIHELRAWEATNAGSVVLGRYNVLGGTFTDVYTLTMADLVDWSPWPNGCNAIRYSAASALVCIVEVRA